MGLTIALLDTVTLLPPQDTSVASASGSDEGEGWSRGWSMSQRRLDNERKGATEAESSFKRLGWA